MELNVLEEHEMKFSHLLKVKSSIFRDIFEGSLVKKMNEVTKAGQPEEIFTGDRETSFIPKKLHQVFFGCDPDRKTASRLPPDFESSVRTWIEKNRLAPDEEPWEHVIWTMAERWEDESDYERFKAWCEEENIIVKDFSKVFQDQEDWKDLEEVIHIALGNQNWGLASDIARFIILKEEGGVYSDLDVECHHRLDHTEVMNADLFIGLEEDREGVYVEGAIMGAQKESVVFTKALEMIRKYKQENLMDDDGIGGLSTLYMTGPYFLSLVFSRYASELSFPRIYPPSFFYPSLHREEEFKSIFPSTNCIAFHSSAKSWTCYKPVKTPCHFDRWEKITRKML